jgi:hypothetical protein
MAREGRDKAEDVTLCSLVCKYQGFEGTHYLHLLLSSGYRSSESLVTPYQTTRHNTCGDINIHNHLG